MTTYVKTDQGRLFLFMDGSADVCSPEIVYATCTSIQGWSKDFGEPTSVECPDPNEFGEFIEVDEIQGQEGRWTNTITTRMPLDEESPIRALARWKEPVDFQINFGIDGDPGNIANFAKKTVVEGARFSNYSSTELTALDSSQRAQVTESVSISAREVYDIYPLRYSLQTTPSVAAAVPLSVVIPSALRGNREGDVIFMVTATDLYMWNSGVVSTFAIANIGGAVRLGGSVLVAVENSGVQIVSWTYNGMSTPVATTIAGITTIDAIAGGDQFAYVASGKTIYRVNSSGTVVTTDLSSLLSGVTDKITAIGVGDDAVVAIDNTGRVIASYDDGDEWSQEGTIALGGAIVKSVAVKSETNWIAGLDDGNIVCTENAFVNTTTSLTSTGNSVNSIVMAGGIHILYAVVGTSVYRSVNGGASWRAEPSKSGTTFPAVTAIASMDVSPDNPNILGIAAVAGGAMRLIRASA